MPMPAVSQCSFRSEERIFLPRHDVRKAGRDVAMAPRTEVVLGGIPLSDPPD